MAASDVGAENIEASLIISDPFPDVVLIKLFNFLTVEELGKLCTVCSQWNRVIRSDSIWRTFLPKCIGFKPPEGDSVYEVVKQMWQKSFRVGREKWYLNPVPELVQFERKLRQAEYIRHFEQDRTKLVLMIRLNPYYQFTTRGKDVSDPEMKMICEEIWDKFGKQNENPLCVKDCNDVMEYSIYLSKKEALERILNELQPDWFLEGINLNPYVLDDEGIIEEMVGNGREEQQQPGEWDGEHWMKWRETFNKPVEKEIYNEIKKLFADNSNHFIIYYLSDGCVNENFQFADNLLISDSAVVHLVEYYEL